MKEKLINNFFHIIPLHYSEFITISYFAAFKIAILFRNTEQKYCQLNFFATYVTSWLACSEEVKRKILSFRKGCGLGSSF